jgi:hypothetical protein
LIWTYPNPDFGPDYKIVALAPDNPKQEFNIVHCANNYEAQKRNPPPGGGSASIKKTNSSADRLVDIAVTLNGALANTAFDIFLTVDGKWAGQKVGSVTTDRTGQGTFSATTALNKDFPIGPHFLGVILMNSGNFVDVYETEGVHKNTGAIVQLK